MKVVIADTGALISLVHVGKVDLIEKVFGELYIAQAVWEELNDYENPFFEKSLLKELKNKVVAIKGSNHLNMIMDYGESESVILYEEVNADLLLLDDRRARQIAESLNVECIGSIGLLIMAKQKGFIKEMRPIFEECMKLRRYFSKKLLNAILLRIGESTIDKTIKTPLGAVLFLKLSYLEILFFTLVHQLSLNFSYIPLYLPNGQKKTNPKSIPHRTGTCSFACGSGRSV